MAKATAGHRIKRWLYLVHRWIGIVTCLLFLIWFVSGLVMVYVPFPGLSAAERRAGLPPIDWGRVRIDPGAAERIASPVARPRALILEMAGTQPVWRVARAEGPPVTLSATTGGRLSSFTADQAVAIASAFARTGAVAVEPVIRDQWTVHGRFDPDRPLYRVSLSGPGGRDLYVSSTSGAVLLDTNRAERVWNWLGSVPHWIYPTVLRRNNEAWRQVVMWVSGPCILVAITGMWIGILRTRVGKRRFRDRRMTPYHGWMLWHHVAGLAGGVMLTLWMFSGWLSVDPGHVFNTHGADHAARAAYLGARRFAPVDPAVLARAAGPDARRIEFAWAAGRSWAMVERSGDAITALDARSLRPAAIDRGSLVAAASRLIPGARIAAIDRLTAPDFYWYDVGALPQLPVLRIKFADAAGSWVHVDPATGRLLGTIDRRGRIYRWLFDLLHKWDLNGLTLNRPAWDAWLWLFSLVGIVTCVSGVWIGWRRLRGRPVTAVAHTRRTRDLTGRSPAGIPA